MDVSPACRLHYLSILLLNVFGQIATFWEIKRIAERFQHNYKVTAARTGNTLAGFEY